jgi:hypothetical protein
MSKILTKPTKQSKYPWNHQNNQNTPITIKTVKIPTEPQKYPRNH